MSVQIVKCSLVSSRQGPPWEAGRDDPGRGAPLHATANHTPATHALDNGIRGL
ncbi:MAG TPA: hypothetical protein VLT45_01105 [Kofleriaceae bacterium]|nr:hypothetical protein [Kofleriaceae bacterium]